MMTNLVGAALILVGASACGATGQTPATAPGGATSGVRISRVDADDAAVRDALRARAVAAVPACDELAKEDAAGHMVVWVDVDAAGQTVAGILHTTFRSDDLSECLARELTGLTLPRPAEPLRARVRLDGG